MDELRHNTREGVLHEAAGLSQRQKTKELARGKGYKAVRHETRKGGTPQGHKEGDGRRHQGRKQRFRLWVEGGQSVSRRGSMDVNHHYRERASLPGILARSDKKKRSYGCLSGTRIINPY